MTDSAQKIIEILDASCDPLTSSEIVEKVNAAARVNRATIYRQLNNLKKQGLIRHVDIGNGVVRFEKNNDHHHHLVCLNCKKIQKITLTSDDERQLTSLELSFSTRYSFRQVRHSLEFIGLCQKCQ